MVCADAHDAAAWRCCGYLPHLLSYSNPVLGRITQLLIRVPLRGEIRHRPGLGAMEPCGWTLSYYQVFCEKSSIRWETTWGS